MQRYTSATRNEYTVPPCPECGSAAHCDWVDVTCSFDDDRYYVPGVHHCTNRECKHGGGQILINELWAGSEP